MSSASFKEWIIPRILPYSGAVASLLATREWASNLPPPRDLSTATPYLLTGLFFITSQLSDIKSTEFGLNQSKSVHETRKDLTDRPSLQELITANSKYTTVLLPIAIMFPEAGIGLTVISLIGTGQNVVISLAGKHKHSRIRRHRKENRTRL